MELFTALRSMFLDLCKQLQGLPGLSLVYEQPILGHQYMLYTNDSLVGSWWTLKHKTSEVVLDTFFGHKYCN